MCGKAALGVGINTYLGLLAHLDAANVAFGDLGLNL